MSYFVSYINGLKFADLQESVSKTSTAVCNNIRKSFSFSGQLTGLLLGNVQSGKTGQMLGIISKLADDGYKLFLLLTTDITDLQRQTFNRVRESLIGFNVFSERDEIEFISNGLNKPSVIVLKKNSRILSKWRNLLLNSNICKGQTLVIFDDEGDAASLNTLINRHRISTINKRLDEIKAAANAGTIYIEVTATPQAILLQSSQSDWRPSFINYFKPGEKYLGGNFFYSSPTSYTISFIGEDELSDVLADDDNLCPEGLQQSILSFLVNCAHKVLNNETNCNFMIHPSSRISAHEKFLTRIQDHLYLLLASYDEDDFNDNLYEAWLNLQSTKPDLEHFEDIKQIVKNLLEEQKIYTITLNSRSFVCRDSNDPDALDLSKNFNIVIGGNTLGRGITFPHLQTIYYCRSSIKPQADTFWQHSRIFGYDRERELVRIFIPPTLHRLFVNLNESNNALIKQIENGRSDIEILYPQGILPTRKNVLDNNYLNVIQGGVNLFPINPIENNITDLDPFILHYADDESVIVESTTLINILKHSGSQNNLDFSSAKLINMIKVLEGKRPSITCRLIVRTNRNLSKGTGTMLSENDRLLGSRFNNDIVLTMYRVNGNIENGWNGSPLWIPNIKFPGNCCFYDMD